MTDIDHVKRPAALLGELPDDATPDYLYPLVIATRMLDNFVVYNDPASDKARALRIIYQVRKELRYAEQRCRE